MHHYVYAAGTTKEKNSVCWLYFTSIVWISFMAVETSLTSTSEIFFKKTLLIPAVTAGARWGWSKAGYLRGKKDTETPFFFPENSVKQQLGTFSQQNRKSRVGLIFSLKILNDS